MEDQLNYKDFRVVTRESALGKLVRNPHFRMGHILDEDLMIVELRKTDVVLNKPRYLGQAILDDAKVGEERGRVGLSNRNFLLLTGTTLSFPLQHDSTALWRGQHPTRSDGY